MFSSSKSYNSNEKRVEDVIVEEITHIGKDTNFTGIMNCDNKIVIEGGFEGEILSGSTLEITSTGNVKGNISANDVIVGGKVEGNIFSKGTLKIFGLGVINGDIETSNIVIEDGAIFNGRCSMIKGDSLKLNTMIQNTKEEEQSSKE